MTEQTKDKKTADQLDGDQLDQAVGGATTDGTSLRKQEQNDKVSEQNQKTS